MSADVLPVVDDRDFTARLIANGRSLQILMRGTADLNVQKQLAIFLDGVHSCAVRRRTPTVMVDLQKLEFMNSSCLKAIVNWVFAIRAEPPERKYQVAFIANPEARWQQRSLQALVSIAGDLVSLQH